MNTTFNDLTDDKKEQFVNSVIKWLDCSDQAAQMSNTELSKFLLDNYWAKQQLGTIDEAVLSEIINRLEELDKGQEIKIIHE